MLQSRVRCLLLSLCVLLLMDGNFAAQAQRPRAGDSSIQIHKLVEEVRILFNVMDQHGRPLPSLKPQDVDVRVDGELVPEFTDFLYPAGLPARLTILVDTSASVEDSFWAEQTAAKRLLDAVSGTSDRTADWAAFSTDSGPGLQGSSWDGLRPGGSTAMLDALSQALQQLPANVQAHAERRVILLLSDGEDNASRHTFVQVLEAAQREDAAIYAAAAHDPRLEFPGDRVLQHLCEATGGSFFLLPSYARIDSVLARLQSDFRSEYAVSFRPPRSNGEERGYLLSIRIHNRRNLRVQSRRQYFSASGG
jgi:Ca-activated chloride channel homolog